MFGLRDFIPVRGRVACDRQPDNNLEAGGLEVFGAYRTAVQTNRFRGNGKPQAIPSRCLPISTYSIKRLKYRLERIFGNPRTMIPD
jgi:hypothetical protein